MITEDGRADVSSASVAWPQLALFFVIATTLMLGASHPSLHVYTHARIRWPCAGFASTLRNAVLV